MKPTSSPSPDALVAHLQKLVAEHLPQLLTESEVMKHLDALGEVRRDFTLKARLGSTPGEPIARASIAVSAHAVGDLNEVKARTSCEHSVRAPKPAAREVEDPGQSRLL